VHARVAPDPALRHLQAKVEQAARGVGLDLPRRRFAPHVTVARLRGDRADGAEVARFLAHAPLPAMPDFAAEDVVLYRSTLTRDGPVYDEMERYRFA
jgi:2'-5' RNA ligase